MLGNIKGFNIDGVVRPLESVHDVIYGKTDPTYATEADLGQRYFNENTGDSFVCTGTAKAVNTYNYYLSANNFLWEDEDHGIISTSTSSSYGNRNGYISISDDGTYKSLSHTNGEPWLLIFRLFTGMHSNATGSQTHWGLKSSAQNSFIMGFDDVSCNSSYDKSKLRLTNTMLVPQYIWVWVKVFWDGTRYVKSWREDNNYMLETLPGGLSNPFDLTGWTYEVVSSSDPLNTQTGVFRVGCSTTSSDNYLYSRGCFMTRDFPKYDIPNFYFELDGVQYPSCTVQNLDTTWSRVQDLFKLEADKAQSFIGNDQFTAEGYQISEISHLWGTTVFDSTNGTLYVEKTNSGLHLPDYFSRATSTFDFYTAISLTDASVDCGVIGGYNGWFFPWKIRTYQNHIELGARPNSTTSCTTSKGSMNIESNTKYYIHVHYEDGVGYKLYCSTDGVNYTLDATHSASVFPCYGDKYIVACDSNNVPLKGTMYLKDTYILLDGVPVWRAVYPYGRTLTANDSTKFLRGDGTWNSIVDDNSTSSTTTSWSASKLNTVIGNIETLLHNLNSGS